MDKNIDLDRLRKALEETVSRFKEFKEVGVNEEILYVYVAHKTKLSIKKVKQMLNAQEEFYTELVNKELIKSV